MLDLIRIATRKSPLALWQAETVRNRLLQHHPEIQVELVPMSTEGDRKLGTPLARIGGKGLFIKELEAALYDGRADLAVHSMKDVTAVLPDGLAISTVLEREDPHDALVSNRYTSIKDMPADAIVGTCSIRRRSQLLASFPELQIKNLRGNVNTRLQKLDDGEYDAIILACAGLQRLGMENRIQESLPANISLPAVGQGIIGIEIKSENTELQSLLQCLHHEPTASRLDCERALSATLNGGCSAPIAAFALIKNNEIFLEAKVIAHDGSRVLVFTGSDSVANAHQLGVDAATNLISQGAMQILEEAEASIEAV